jgi:beta-mannosidase
MKKYLLYIFILIILASCSHETRIKQDLSTAWEFHQINDDKTYYANVPGCIHADLYEHGLIPDPYFRDNEASVQWIGESTWEYTSEFIPAPGLLDKENIELVFEGLDTYTEVYLNNTLIISADNMFRTWKTDVKDLLVPGSNILSLVFSPPGEKNAEKAAALPYKLPDNRAFTRKSPYHFGWDWGPEFITCGIWKPVYLHAWENFRIQNIYVSHPPPSDEGVNINVHLAIEADATQSVRIKVFDDEKTRLAFEKHDLEAGINNITLDYYLENPELWWPNGLGEPKLYTIRISIMDMGWKDERITTFGIREIELIRDKDEFGESFYFKVNGLPVFMKGANYIPQDNFLPRVDNLRYEKLIKSVVDANMNMLRVWGGGFYENDIFYDLCDRNGILLWQDFMFACNMYPGDDHFLANVRSEAIDNVIRLRNHPCIALWCGNNEIDEGWHNWGWQKQLGYSTKDSAAVWHDYETVFHDILPAVVEKYDPGTIYWPSSPMTGWGRDEAYTQGDVHYWGVWWGEEAFDMYREKTGRFVSEYGFQGMPAMETVLSFTEPQDRYIGSPVMEAHQKHPRGTKLIQKYMEREFIIPEKFEDYLYVSQVLQADGMAEAFFSHRISQPFCMGTLYWQLNDCWPVTSWAGLDYYGKWKALHYHVKRAYKPLMVSAEENDSLVHVFVVNDHPGEESVELSIQLSSFNGNILDQQQQTLTLPALTNQKVLSIAVPELALEDKVLVSTLHHGDTIISRSFYYFVPTKDMKLLDPELTFEIDKTGQGLQLTLHATNLARQVYLEAPGFNGRFDDNFFDMAAGETKTVIYKGNEDINKMSEILKIKNIYDTYH